MILIDAGPLVATLHADDRHHARCVAALQLLREPVGTVWPVIGEAMFLLRFSWESQDALWNLIATQAVRLLPTGLEDLPRMHARDVCHDRPFDPPLFAVATDHGKRSRRRRDELAAVVAYA